MSGILNGLGSPIQAVSDPAGPFSYRNGLPFSAGKLAISGDLPDHYHQGLGFTAAGLLCVGDGPVTHWQSGAAPVNALGQLVVGAGPVTHYTHGVPYSADGGVVMDGTQNGEAQLVFHAASYDPDTFELQQESVGVGGETCTHTAEIYSPNKDGVYHAFPANAPVWEGFRESAGQYFADDGAGTLLDPLPMLVYQKATTNHFLNSAAPVTQDVTVVSGQDYTVWVLGAGSITLSGAGTGVATEGNKFTFTASTTTLTCTYAATLTHVQVEDGVVQNGLITTAGTAVSTDEIINTWAAANHSDAGDSYEITPRLTGEDQVLLSMGGVDVLSTLSDGNELVTSGDVAADWNPFTNTVTDDAETGAVKCVCVDVVAGMQAAIRATGVLDFDLVSGHTYRLTFQAKKGQSGDSFTVIVGAGGQSTFPIDSTTFEEYEIIVIKNGGHPYMQFASMNAGESVFVKDLSLREVGAGVPNVTLSDGTNSCSTPVVSAEPHIKASYNVTDGLVLDVDGVTATSAYDGTLGSGDLSTKATQRDLIRSES